MRRLLLLVAGAATLASVLVGGGGATTSVTPAPRYGGTVLFGADQEPLTLNVFVVGGDHLWAAAAHYPTMAGTFTITPRFQYRNDLVSKVVFTKKPFTVTYHVKPNARWSDGRPITARDYVFTWQTIMNRRWNIVSTIGYEDITRATILGPKVVKFSFKKPFAGWRDLFGEILPRHALQGEDFNNVWRSAINNPKNGRPIASGPFFLASWNRGSSMVFKRNERYWGKRAYLRQIIFRFVPDTNTQVQQIRGGELDVLNPQPQLSLAPLRNERRLRVQSSTGPVWEKLDFNLGYRGGGHTLLKQRYMRQAFAHGLNRQALVRTILGPINPRLPVLNSAIIMSNSVYYRPHWAKYTYDPARARRILEQNGCRRGGDGIYVCGGQRASFRWMSTTGNQRRELTFEIAQAQLRNVGIEVKSDFSPPSVVFGQRKIAGDYDILDAALSSATPDISGWDSAYGCRTDVEAQQNDLGYCNRRVDALLKRSNTELDQRRQAALVNQALALMANDIPILPLYQLPSYLIHKRTIRGIIDNPLSSGPLWNLNQGGWWISQS
jgi:peptide/nickel transport system substrate-binding protein